MSAEIKSKKRSSTGDATTSVNKKVKTTKSADKPTPLKSALKKTSKTEEKTAAPIKEKKSKTAKASKKEMAENDDGGVAVTEETAVVNGDKPAKVKKTKTTKPAASKKAAKETTTTTIDASDSDSAPADPTTDLTADQTAALLAGFSDSGSDASDNEADDGLDISTLPQPPTSSAVQKQIAKLQADPERVPGVVYLGRIPHGFYEPQMRAYFSQFGSITHLKLARNPKTGKSRHFAFIEFASKAVAEIVVKTMDKYLLFGHILQVRNVPAERVGEGFWRGTGRKVMPRNRLEGARLRRGVHREGWEGRVRKEEERRLQKVGKLAELGYQFEMPGLKKVEDVPVRAAAVAAVEGDGEVTAVEAEKVEADGTEVVKAVEAKPDGVEITEKVKGKKRPAAKDTGAVKKSKKAKKVVAA
ncbi:hypothetical protein MBLNU230_g1463t1 [Neophaeotheca triangularis]